MTLSRTLRRACLLTAAAVLAASIGAKPLYAVEAGKADADKTTTKSHKKNASKDTATKPKPQADNPAGNSTGFNPGGY